MGWAELFLGKPRDVSHSSDLPAGLSAAAVVPLRGMIRMPCLVIASRSLNIEQFLSVITPAVLKHLFKTMLQGAFMIRSCCVFVGWV